MDGSLNLKRALISVSDKNGVVEFASLLARYGVKIISTGGTAKLLRDAGLKVTEVSEVTGFPEMMDGRVKTLHPNIHGALLAVRDDPAHVKALAENQIDSIDLVVVNLYPFEQTVERDGVSLAEAVENIDIGGPAMIRSAAKNWRHVGVVTDPAQYVLVSEELSRSGGCLSLQTRQRLAMLAYARTAGYDLSISSYLAKQLSDEDLELLEPLNPLAGLVFIESEDLDDEDIQTKNAAANTDELPEEIEIRLGKIIDLRYGENPHQKAALYRMNESGVALAEQLHGKEMSYNNFIDADAAWRLVSEFDVLAAAIIKHTNPSGVGIGNTMEEAYRRALATDPVSAFGGIVAFNRIVDTAAARAMSEIFIEVVVAPDFETDALEILMSKKNLRVLRMGNSDDSCHDDASIRFRQISGGILAQTGDNRIIEPQDLRVVTRKEPVSNEIDAMLFAWRVCKHVKSNAIVVSNSYQTLGVGAGQMNRVDSLRIAAMRAERFGHSLGGAALASDAFFPFRDNVDEAAKLGIAAIIQPGGSIKDKESIEAADEHGIAMAFTGIRHFCH